MISEGFILMVIGMTVVFLFLLLLVILMKLLSVFVAWFNKIYPEDVKKDQQKKSHNYGEIALAIAAVKANTK